MRNRDLHDALREFALESAAFLSDEIRDGAELEFDVVDGGHGGGPSLIVISPRTSAFLDVRWEGLRQLPGCEKASAELGRGRFAMAARERHTRRAGGAGAAG